MSDPIICTCGHEDSLHEQGQGCDLCGCPAFVGDRP